MRRREFIKAILYLGGASAFSQLGASAEEGERIYRIGILSLLPREVPQFAAFFDELRHLGFIEGQNVMVHPGGFGLHQDQLPAKAAELAQAKVDVILINGGGVTIRAAQQATTTIPIVGLADDMVAEGLVRSLAHPGGQTTGISILAPELDGKRQELIMELLPNAHQMAVLADTRITTSQQLRTLEDAVRAHGVELSIYRVDRPQEIVPAINAAQASGSAALNVLAASLFSSNRQSIIERTAALRLPAIYQWPEMAEQGGLIAYGPRLTDLYRQSARLFAKVLHGAKPTDIPVEQPTKFALVVNLKTAKALGLNVPPALLARADEVIE
jgi:putative ABC transport system substrate-binding protein